MIQYDKQALTTDQQIDLLIQRGMQITDRTQAQQHLSHINYYRLRAYWLPFEQTASKGSNHTFISGTDFATVLTIYNFDRELRLLLIDAIERIEISLRTQLTNILSLRHGPFAHEDGSHFSNQRLWKQSLDNLTKEYSSYRKH